MTLLEYEGFDGLGLAELVKQGDVSPAELLETAIRLTTERNPHLNAIVIEAFDQARSVVTRQLPSGPFTGDPVSPQGPLYLHERAADDQWLPHVQGQRPRP